VSKAQGVAKLVGHRGLEIILVLADLGRAGAGVPVPALEDGDFARRAVVAAQNAVGGRARGAGGADVHDEVGQRGIAHLCDGHVVRGQQRVSVDDSVRDAGALIRRQSAARVIDVEIEVAGLGRVGNAHRFFRRSYMASRWYSRQPESHLCALYRLASRSHHWWAGREYPRRNYSRR
jgi:hypothetical protein